jgi:hypothetical protein
MSLISYRHQPIHSLAALGRALGETVESLTMLAANADRLYRLAKPIPKDDGTFRRPFDALEPLKPLHRKIKDRLFSGVEFPTYMTGSLRGTDYRVNAGLHLGSKIVICEDVEKFFPSTTSSQVKSIWVGVFGFPEDVADCLTKLTTKNGFLPEGAITSSYLANLTFWRDEPALVEEFRNCGLTYSRYVDDITVSSKTVIDNATKEMVIAKIYGMLRKNGYSAKRRKHEIKTGKGRMVVTKLTVNKSVGITKSSRHRVRAALHQLEQKIKTGNFSFEISKEISSVEGRINSLASLHPGEAIGMKHRLQIAKAVAQTNL